MTLFAESSAVLTWLLSQPRGHLVLDALESSDSVVISELTLVETDRTLLRELALGGVTAAVADALQARLVEVAATWNVQALRREVLDRARASFPDDRIRSLDAIHLASAVVARASLGDMDLLSLDERIRSNAAALGFRVLPE